MFLFQGNEKARLWFMSVQNSGIEDLISACDEGPCMGIELNLWERTKVGFRFVFIFEIILIIFIILNMVIVVYSIRQARSHIVHTLVGGSDQHRGFDALDYRKIRNGNGGKLAHIPSSWCCLKTARFLFELLACRFESLDLQHNPLTEMTLMCTEHFLMIRYIR